MYFCSGLQRRLLEVPDGKVAFFVPTGNLVQQQHKVLEKYLPGVSMKPMRGDKKGLLSVSNMLQMAQILILTPQLLLNNTDEVEITDFSLIIFDECHKTAKKYSYNLIMGLYHDKKHRAEKFPNQPIMLPQVIGLTATPGIGDAKKKEAAVEYMIEFMANMDAVELKPVTECSHDLASFQNRPVESEQFSVDHILAYCNLLYQSDSSLIMVVT